MPRSRRRRWQFSRVVKTRVVTAAPPPPALAAAAASWCSSRRDRRAHRQRCEHRRCAPRARPRWRDCATRAALGALAPRPRSRERGARPRRTRSGRGAHRDRHAAALAPRLARWAHGRGAGMRRTRRRCGCARGRARVRARCGRSSALRARAATLALRRNAARANRGAGHFALHARTPPRDGHAGWRGAAFDALLACRSRSSRRRRAARSRSRPRRSRRRSPRPRSIGRRVARLPRGATCSTSAPLPSLACCATRARATLVALRAELDGALLRRRHRARAPGQPSSGRCHTRLGVIVARRAGQRPARRRPRTGWPSRRTAAASAARVGVGVFALDAGQRRQR